MRNGKIARLPAEVREELNLRLNNHEDGAATLQWLNNLPEVIELVSKEFNRVPISKQNLYEWRQGGFREWRIRQELAEAASDMSSFSYDIGQVADAPLLAGDLVTNVAARYAAILNSWDGTVDSDMNAKVRVLRGLAHDLALIQRTIYRATKQKTEYDAQLEEERKRVTVEAKGKVLAPIWAMFRSASLAKLFGDDEEGKKLAEIVTAVHYDLPLPDGIDTESGKSQSNRVKPNSTSANEGLPKE